MSKIRKCEECQYCRWVKDEDGESTNICTKHDQIMLIPEAERIVHIINNTCDLYRKKKTSIKRGGPKIIRPLTQREKKA